MNFVKYSATGNDFIIFEQDFVPYMESDKGLVAKLCSRKTNIGADGVLLYLPSEDCDFEMRYLNSDGGEVGMCGNGARALIHYAHHVKNISQKIFKFKVNDQIYQGKIAGDEVELLMEDIKIQPLKLPNWSEDYEESFYLKVGVPHVVLLTFNIDALDINSLGAQYAHDKCFDQGCNINFVEVLDLLKKQFKIRTYERGVEGETLSCGTGTTATAVALSKHYDIEENMTFATKGGKLVVKINEEKEFLLCGNAKKIYNGNIDHLK